MEGAPAVFLPNFYSFAPLLLLRGGTQDITIPPFIPNPLTRASKNHLALLGAPGPQRREAGDITEPSTARNIFAYFRGSFSWVDGDPDYSRGVRVVSIPTSVSPCLHVLSCSSQRPQGLSLMVVQQLSCPLPLRDRSLTSLAFALHACAGASKASLARSFVSVERGQECELRR